MTKIIQQNDKKNTFENQIPKILYQQCKTQVALKQKNISKFIFVQSSDDQNQKKQDKQTFNSLYQTQRVCTVDHDLTINRQRPISRDFKAQPQRLKPSIMRGYTDDQQDYEEIINCETVLPTRKFPASGPILKKGRLDRSKKEASKMFEQIINEREKIVNSKLIQRKQVVRSELREKGKQKKPKQAENNVTVNEETPINIPKMQIATIFFQQSDEETDLKTESSKPIVEDRQKQQLKCEYQVIRKDQNKFQKESQHSINHAETASFLAESQQFINQKIDITECIPSPVIQKRSLYLEELLNSSNQGQTDRISILKSPILPMTRQIFTVQVRSTLAINHFYCWLDMGQEAKFLMKAIKSIKLNKTTYQIVCLESKYNQFVDAFVLESNIDRSQYNLYSNQYKINKRGILATITQSVNLKNTKLLVAYFPKVDKHNQPALLYQNNNSHTLYSYYRQGQTQSIDYIMTTKMDTSRKLKMMDYYNLKVSQKSMQFKNSSGGIQVIIGKQASKKYKIISGPGLSPIQIFALSIVQIQT